MQAWHISFAEYISLLKYDFLFFRTFLCSTLCGEMLSRVRLIHALPVSFLVIITSEIRNPEYTLCEEGRLSQCY